MDHRADHHRISVILRGLLGKFLANLGQLGANLDNFGANSGELGANVAHLGPNPAQIFSNLGQLGTNMAPTWPILVPTWANQAPTWPQNGAHKLDVWRSCLLLGPRWPPNSSKRASGIDFGAILDDF